MTVLEVVNQVLRRLREDQVTALTDTTQAQLLAELVRDAVIQIQDMHNWSMLKSTISVATVASDYDYTLTGAGKRFKVLDVWNDTEECFLREKSAKELNRLLNITDVSTTIPTFYGFDTHDSSGDPTVRLWPVPDGVYNIDFHLFVPQSRDDLTESTEIKIPAIGVIYLTWAMAITERGEDAGASATMVDATARQHISASIAQDWERNGLERDFYLE